MKFYIAALLIFLFAETTFSQNAKLDSLDQLISKATTDTARINLTTEKLFHLNRINIDSALDLGNKTLQKSISLGYKHGEAMTRLNLSTGYTMKGEFASAAQNLAISKAIFLSLKDSAGLCGTYSNYGMLYGMQSKYDTSIQYLEKAIAIAERNNFQNRLGLYYNNIAIGYQMQSNYLEALRYQQKSLDLAKAKSDISGQAYTSVNMGINYSLMRDTVRAEQLFLEAVKLAKLANIKNVELYAYSNLAGIYSKKGEPEKAYGLAMKAAQLGKEMGDHGIEATSLSRAAKILAMMKKFAAAETMVKQAMTIADSSGQTYNIYQVYSAMGSILKQQEKYTEATPILEKSIAVLEKTDLYNEEVEATYNNLSFCYEKTGNFSKALSYYKLSSGIADSIRSRDNIRKATELNMNYEFNKKQEAQQIQQENKDAITRTRQLALAIGLGLAFILAIVSYSAFRNKQKANTQLQVQKKEIENTLIKLKETQTQLVQAEKMASLGELTAGIAHEIQNPLNFVNNFSELNTELIDELMEEIDKGDMEEIKSIADNIKQNEYKINHHGKRADAIVKGMLQHSRTTSGKKEPTDINALADEYLRLSYHGLRAKDKLFNADFKTEFDERIGKTEVVPQDIGRVLLNLYNNAFYSVSEKKKHNGETYKPLVSVSTKKINTQIRISIRDNGIGIPPNVMDKIYQPFFTTKPTGEGTGLGLSLSYDIITKTHNGTLEVKSEEGEFAEFIITLPVS